MLPWGLRLFGEQSYDGVQASNSELSHAKELFPEATQFGRPFYILDTFL